MNSSFVIAVLLLFSILVPANGIAADRRSGAENKGETALKPRDLPHMTFLEEGRPAKFYRSLIDREPSVCGPLLAALNEPYQRLDPGAGDFEQDLLLGNRHSLDWEKLGSYTQKTFFSRTVIDLNDDGKPDVIYKYVSTSHRGYGTNYYWTKSFPKGEVIIKFRRFKELIEKKIKSGPWKDSESNVIIISEDKGRNKQTIHPPLPNNIHPESFNQFEDIVRVKGRHRFIVANGKYLDKRLHVFVFRSRAPRDHALSCLFISAYIIRSTN